MNFQRGSRKISEAIHVRFFSIIPRKISDETRSKKNLKKSLKEVLKKTMEESVKETLKEFNWNLWKII